MVKVELIFDNKFASPLSPEKFVKEYYLTGMAEEDMVYFNVKQDDWKSYKGKKIHQKKIRR